MDAQRTDNFRAPGNVLGSGYAMWPQQEHMMQPEGGSRAAPQTFNYGANIFNINFMNPGQYELNFAVGNGLNGINAHTNNPLPNQAVPFAPPANVDVATAMTPRYPMTGMGSVASTSSNFPNHNGGLNDINLRGPVYLMNTPIEPELPVSSVLTPGRPPIRPGDCRLCQAVPNLANQHTSSNCAYHQYREGKPIFPSHSTSISSIENDLFRDEDDEELRSIEDRSLVASSGYSSQIKRQLSYQ